MTLPFRLANRHLSKSILTIGISIFFILGLVYLLYRHPVGYIYLIAEDHWIEYATFVCFIAACFLLCKGFWQRSESRKPGWFFFAVVTFLIAMEEISWGQRFFNHIGWTIPQFFQQNNLQQESNLHNLVDIADFKITIAIIILSWSIILPLLANRSTWLQQKCNQWGILLVPTHLFPLFLPSILIFAFSPNLRKSEFAELFLGIAMVALCWHVGITMQEKQNSRRKDSNKIKYGSLWIILVFSSLLLTAFASKSSFLKQYFHRFASFHFQEVGMNQQAKVTFDFVITQPDLLHPETYLQRGLLFQKMGYPEEAQKSLEIFLSQSQDDQGKLVKLEHLSPYSYRNHAIALQALGRKESAQDQFQKALEIDLAKLQSAKDKKTQTNIQISLANTFLAMGDDKTALKLFAEIREHGVTKSQKQIAKRLMRRINED